jgi:endonuclease G, mitochondrial
MPTESGSGYRSAFLRLRIALPRLTPEQRADAAPMLGTERVVLPYTNFSLVMSKSRRLARYTAVNIDGRALVPMTRPSDVWRYDRRIDLAFQVGKRFYEHNVFDQGHLVRRLDPVWGQRALQAHKDTFYLTNCAPQHEVFNRDEWGNIEDYILKNTQTHGLRVSVFTGPVFGADDPLVKDVRVPLEFWKIVAMMRTDGAPSVTAYLHTQRNLLGVRDFVFGAYQSYQVRVSEIVSATGLAFGALGAHDPLGRTRSLNIGHALRRLADIRL